MLSQIQYNGHFVGHLLSMEARLSPNNRHINPKWQIPLHPESILITGKIGRLSLLLSLFLSQAKRERGQWQKFGKSERHMLVEALVEVC